MFFFGGLIVGVVVVVVVWNCFCFLKGWNILLFWMTALLCILLEGGMGTVWWPWKIAIVSQPRGCFFILDDCVHFFGDEPSCLVMGIFIVCSGDGRWWLLITFFLLLLILLDEDIGYHCITLLKTSMAIGYPPFGLIAFQSHKGKWSFNKRQNCNGLQLPTQITWQKITLSETSPLQPIETQHNPLSTPTPKNELNL